MAFILNTQILMAKIYVKRIIRTCFHKKSFFAYKVISVDAFGFHYLKKKPSNGMEKRKNSVQS